MSGVGQRFRGNSAVGRGYRCHLPLQQLQDHIYISCHPGFQSLERKREKEWICMTNADLPLKACFILSSGYRTCWVVTAAAPDAPAADSVWPQHRGCDGGSRPALQRNVSDSLSTDWPCGRANSRITPTRSEEPLYRWRMSGKIKRNRKIQSSRQVKDGED